MFKKKSISDKLPANVDSEKDNKKKRTVLKKMTRPFKALRDYFVGAWYELKQVRWTNRRATWALTGAVIAFTVFFVVLVMLLDAGFEFLFDKIIQ
jgi:preprotein translocase SecE subunit